MIDTTGSEPHDQDGGKPLEDDLPQEAQDAITEPPSEDEFSDDAAPEEQPDAKPSTRSAFLPIAAAVGGVLLLGSVAWWSLNDNTSFALLPPINKVVSNFSSPTPSSSRAGENKPIASTVPTSLIATLPTVSPKTDSAAQKEEGAIESSLGVSSSARPSLPENANQQDKPIEGVAQNAPVVSVLSIVPAVSPVAENVTASVLSAPVQAAGDSDRRIEALTIRVDSLQKALDRANQQLEQMSVSRAVSSAQENADSSTKALQERLDKLEQQIDAAHRPTASAEQVATVAPANTTEGAVFASPIEKPAPVVKHKTVRKIDHKTAKTTAAEKPSSTLVLRAVSSGHAWVAKNVASSELMEVIVGDKVAGIGTVKAIEQHGGKWIVRGTKGTIQ